jgi:DDE superfamily endonuclease
MAQIGQYKENKTKQNTKASNKNYSKKKKSHTRKNITVVGKGKTGDKREILILTPTRNGRRHDKKITDKDEIYRYIPPEVETYQDTGFQGANKHNQHQDNQNFHIPKKKSRIQPLTDQDKFLNQLISSIRVTVEHSNWGLKRLNSITHIFRHKLSQLDDTYILLASGVWNFHLLHNNTNKDRLIGGQQGKPLFQ